MTTPLTKSPLHRSVQMRHPAETAVCWYTVVIVSIYFPVETWASYADGLLSPYYLIDIVAMALMTLGACVSLRARPEPAPGILGAGYAFCAANGWRAAADRLPLIQSDSTDWMTLAECIVITASTIVALGIVFVFVWHEWRVSRNMGHSAG